MKAMNEGEIRRAYLGPDMPVVLNATVESLLNTKQGWWTSMSAHERADWYGRVHEAYQMAKRLEDSEAQGRLDSLVGDLEGKKYEYSGSWGKNDAKEKTTKQYSTEHKHGSARDLMIAMNEGKIRRAYLGPDMPVVLNATVEALLNTKQGWWTSMSAHERADWYGRVNAAYQMAKRLGDSEAQGRLDSLVGDLEGNKYEYSGSWGNNRR